MNTSIDQINKSRYKGESGGIPSINSEAEKKKLSGFFMESYRENDEDNGGKETAKKKTLFYEGKVNDGSFGGFRYKRETGNQARFSLDVNEYRAPKVLGGQGGKTFALDDGKKNEKVGVKGKFMIEETRERV